MPKRLFYSWQSDIKQNRTFIRSALDEAVKEIAQDTSIDEALREISVDQDTQGVPGSPSVVDAILQKIRSCEFFVADLTFVADSDGRATPNPNVLLEYGYALHAISDSRIIAVFNDAHGDPKDLPFDLVHRRWPIRFTLAAQNPTDRPSAKRKLAKSLSEAIRSIISQFAVTSAVREAAPVYAEVEPGDGIGSLREAGDYLCMPDEGEPILLAQGPYAFLRLIPSEPPRLFGGVEAYRIVQQNLQPMTGMRSGGGTTCRHSTGAVSYWAAQTEPHMALDASQLFLTGEIWGNSFYALNTWKRSSIVDFPFIATGFFEEVIIDTLVNYRTLARQEAKLALPVKLKMGLVGVANYRLAVDRRYFSYDEYAGRILNNEVTYETELDDWSADPFDVLQPFFYEIYDKAGVTRPDVRSKGRRPT